MHEPLTSRRSLLKDLAHEHGTPLFVYDGDAMRVSAVLSQSLLGEHSELFYSMKSNPNVAVVALMHAQGLGIEIASLGEFAAARHAGVDPSRIIFAGPGKTDVELEQAVKSGVHQINSESQLELDRISIIARREGVCQRVGVRVNLESHKSGKITTSGSGTKFGIESSRVPDAVRQIVNDPNLDFGGLHLMLASQVLDARVMIEHAERSFAFAAGIESSLRVPIPSVNLGGGLGVSHRDDDPLFDLNACIAGIREALKQSQSSGALVGTTLAIEPGRILTSEHGVYLSRVIDVKETGSGHAAVLDGGIHHALLPITANAYRITNISGDASDLEIAYIGGPLCTSADQWSPTTQGLSAKHGDILAMSNCGAYGLTAGMTMFLSRGTPPEILILEGTAHLVRHRSRSNDIVASQQIPEALQAHAR